MKMSKTKKRPIALTLVISLILSLMMSTLVFADVTPGPNGEYCTITYISGVGNAWNSTPSNPMYGGKAVTGTDILGNTGGLPVTIEFSANCTDYLFAVLQVDSQGHTINGGTEYVSPTFRTNTVSPGSLTVQLPSSWFIKGDYYKVFSYGAFPGISQCPMSSAFVEIVN
ncbi:hypothetical protein ACJDU8_15835 [Clostridium sp. WILCCON 0269]|uniref:Uncharacterized protein n=1 Tax=Candidatus Clostridium eludens TaxID=3381663 RepID=A0ABW8SPA6_9CLOT